MTPIVFILVFLAGCVAAIFKNPIFGLYTYLFTFYMSPSDNWWGKLVPDLRYLFIIAVITLGVTIIRTTKDERPSWLSFTPSKLLIGIILYMWLQYLWAYNRGLHLEGTIMYTKHLIVYFLIYKLINTRERLLTFLIIHIVGCFWFGYLALDAGSGRLEEIGGPVGGSNELGIHVSTAGIIGGVLWLTQPGWPRYVIMICIPFIVNTLILTLSRGAFLGFLSAGLSAGYFIPRVYTGRFIQASFLALFLVIVLANEDFSERMTGFYESLTNEQVELDKSALSRKYIFRAGIEVGKDNPFGNGFKSYPALSAKYLDPIFHSTPGVGRSAHNTFAGIFAEHGIVVVILYFSITLWVISVLLHARKGREDATPPQDRAFTVAIGSALIGMYVSGNFSANMDTETQYWLVALLCCHLSIEAERRERSETASV